MKRTHGVQRISSTRIGIVHSRLITIYSYSIYDTSTNNSLGNSLNDSFGNSSGNSSVNSLVNSLHDSFVNSSSESVEAQARRVLG